MNLEIRECGSRECKEMNRVYYHIFKNGTKHLVMLCPIHRYVGLPYESGLNIPYYNKNDASIETLTKETIRIAKQAAKQKKIARGMSAKQLLSM
jgi:hypothetical protein